MKVYSFTEHLLECPDQYVTHEEYLKTFGTVVRI